MNSAVLVLPVLALAGCGWQGPPLAGEPGLQFQVTSYYRDHALQGQASCPNPEMQSVTRATVVEDTPERLVLDVRYYWVDWSQAVDIRGGSITTCRGRDERRFTFARATDGSLQPVAMTGPLKRG